MATAICFSGRLLLLLVVDLVIRPVRCHICMCTHGVICYSQQCQTGMHSFVIHGSVKFINGTDFIDT